MLEFHLSSPLSRFHYHASEMSSQSQLPDISVLKSKNAISQQRRKGSLQEHTGIEEKRHSYPTLSRINSIDISAPGSLGNEP